MAENQMFLNKESPQEKHLMVKGEITLLPWLIVVFLLAWTGEAAVDYLCHPEQGFLNLWILDVSTEDLVGRILLGAVFITFCVLLYRYAQRQHQTAAALSQGESLLESIFQSSPGGLMIKDRELTIIRANPAIEKIFGGGAPLVGRKCYEALRDREAPCPDCFSLKAMASLEPVVQIVPRRGPGGGEEGWLEIYAYPLRDPGTGQVTGVIHFSRDITARLAAEQALQDSEARYRLLVENIPAVVFKGYADWTLEFFDGKIEELTGYPKEEFNSRRRKWSDVIVPEDLEAARQAFVEALKTTRSYVREYRIRHRDGRILWIQAHGRILLDTRGQVDSVHGVFFDITAQREAEEALRRSEARLGEAQRIAHLGHWEWEIRTDHGFCSDEASRIMGFAPQGGRTYDQYLQAVHPEDRAKVQQAANQALQGGQSFQLEYRVLRPDGLVRFVYAQAEVQRDAAGLPLRMVGTVQDITDLKEAQKALAESERRYRLLAENVTDVIWTSDLNLRLTYVSPSVRQQRGYSPEEVMQQSLEEMLPPASLSLARTRLAAALAREEAQHEDRFKPETMELEVLCKGGGTTWVEVQASFLRDEVGQAVGLVGVTRDITARRQLEEQLRQAQRLEVVGRLAGGVAHDFNNLLTAILGYSGLLANHLPPDHPGRRDVSEIRKAGERAALLTRQLLAFSRRQVLQPRSTNLNQVVRDLGKILQRLIGEDIRLRILPGPELGRVMADPGQLEQVLLNLTVNARDAMPRGGTLTIRTANVELGEAGPFDPDEAPPGPYILLEVEDTGCGMDAETRAHIFEPFFTTKEVGKGTGLGLSTVYGIIKQSGGHLMVESEPGRGATFRIYLPRIAAAAGTAPTAWRSDVHPRGSETVLLVEDEAMVRQISRRILERQGYRILEAGDGRAALEVWQQHPGPIHLLLTDLVMPGMSGRELAARLVSQSPQLKVIYMSGYAEDDIIPQDLAGPEQVFLQKPFEAGALTRKVRELLDEA